MCVSYLHTQYSVKLTRPSSPGSCYGTPFYHFSPHKNLFLDRTLALNIRICTAGWFQPAFHFAASFSLAPCLGLFSTVTCDHATSSVVITCNLLANQSGNHIRISFETALMSRRGVTELFGRCGHFRARHSLSIAMPQTPFTRMLPTARSAMPQWVCQDKSVSHWLSVHVRAKWYCNREHLVDFCTQSAWHSVMRIA